MELEFKKPEVRKYFRDDVVSVNWAGFSEKYIRGLLKSVTVSDRMRKDILNEKDEHEPFKDVISLYSVVYDIIAGSTAVHLKKKLCRLFLIEGNSTHMLCVSKRASYIK